jgi:adenylosuccinate synthase
MARSAHAIIGANWGDEGKGLAVDAISHRLAVDHDDVVVVRSNGGAQAGHGVQQPDGRRHVFHHIGAGTFAGAATHLSQHFVAHPMVLQNEIQDLTNLNAAPRRVTIDPRAPVTTPWDMAINQALELQRSGAKHGSTGLGFGETLERHENPFPGFRFSAADLWSDELNSKIASIMHHWMPARLAELGIDIEASPLADILSGRTNMKEQFLSDCHAFRNTVSLMDDAELGQSDALVFEGAQGLQLDQDYGAFPHVTRSYTGLRNMLSIAAEAGIEEIAPHYMTRAYATRHGAGPLPHEVLDAGGHGRISWANVVDLTNAPNGWQGTIRHAALDLDLMRDTIARDVNLAEGTGVMIDETIGITCMDQVNGRTLVYQNGALRAIDFDDVVDAIGDAVGLYVVPVSYGPTRDDVMFRARLVVDTPAP